MFKVKLTRTKNNLDNVNTLLKLLDCFKWSLIYYSV